MDVYKALADQTRRLLLDELLDRDEQNLFELCARLAVITDRWPPRARTGAPGDDPSDAEEQR